ncbi:MAG: GSCFA domain-containing protein [Bacteroidota bacterium]
MKFRTEIIIPKQENLIDYQSNIVLFGSCFTENMESHFNYLKFNNTANSHGIIFNPVAIEKAVSDCVEEKKYDQNDLYHHNELWLSLNHHTRFSSDKQEEVLTKINSEIQDANRSLKKASHVLITLGTARVYRFKETSDLVANCHKVPQKYFDHELLSIQEIIASLNRIIKKIESVNTNITFLFTVSPVRHIKDGLAENSLSKAHLLSAIRQVVDARNYFYFPSYEIMMDDLRDYRFYASDMVHPNEIAMEYIWDKFKGSWISEESYQLMKEIDNIQRSLQHRPFRKNSKQYQDFLKNLENKIESIESKYPQIRFNEN